MLDQQQPIPLNNSNPALPETLHGLAATACELTGAGGAVLYLAGNDPAALVVAASAGAAPPVGAVVPRSALPPEALPVSAQAAASDTPLGFLVLLDAPAPGPAIRRGQRAVLVAAGYVLQTAQHLEASRRAPVERAALPSNEFLSIVSHELRTPLSAILGYSDILLRGLHGPLSEHQAHTQQRIRDNAQRLLGMINDLLDASKLDAGSVQLTPGLVALPQVAALALASVRAPAAADNVRLVLDIAPTVPLVAADAERLHQILVHLLTNAIKFTPAGGQITIAARPSALPAAAAPNSVAPGAASPAQSVELTVQDTGIGLAADQMAHIWERFYQADSTSSRRYGGAGLGLYIVQTLVALHGGCVWASSPGPNQGTTIHVRLPLAAPAAAGPLAEERPATGTATIPQSHTELS